MLNTFENDTVYISAKWLINLVKQRGLRVKHLVRVAHRATGAIHYVVLLRDGRYMCDCCMDQNLGLVCRHYFILWVTIQDLQFHLSFIRSRWYQDPKTDLSRLPAVTKKNKIQPENLRLNIQQIPSPAFVPVPDRKNTIKHQDTSHSAYATETLPAREVFHEVQTALRLLVAHLQTREQVDSLLQSLNAIG
ncbi:hypothetical protein C8J57DRAFT_1061696 [Mycena rebaudengoi]|nr:hypothetical protein C8J57DRAFT_1061696 [Mycena rebaudengoi]